MSILGMTGFESYTFSAGTTSARNNAANLMDRIVVLGGTLTRTATVPDTSPSTHALQCTSNDIGSIPWWNDAAGTRNEPGTSFWFHGQARITTNGSTNNDLCRWGTSSNDDEFITLSWEDGTTNVTLRVAGTVRVTSSYASGIDSYVRYMVEVTGVTLTTHTVKVYVDGDLTAPIINYTLVAGDVSALAAIGSGNANGFYFRSGLTSVYLDDLWAMDPNDGTGATDPALFRDSGIRGQVATGDGSPLNWSDPGGGTGSYVDIDRITDTDYISASATATESQFSHDSIALNVERIGAVKVMAHVSQSDTSAGTQIGLGFDDGASTVQKDSAVPGAGYVTNIYDEKPGTGAWTPATYDASDLLVISVA